MPDSPSATVDSPPPGEDWELAPTQLEDVDLIPDDEFVPVDPFSMTEAERQQAYENSMNDPLWYAADGERFEALFVSADGTIYGRRGGAESFPVPTSANGFGASEVAPDLDEALEVEFGLGISFGAGSGQTPAARGSDFAAPADDPEALPNYVGTDYWNDGRGRWSTTSALSSHPLRTIGSVNPNGNVTTGRCTGTKVGPRSILTASHCLMATDGSLNMGSSAYFHPGQTNSSAINGSYQWSGFYLRDYRLGAQYDYAVLAGPENPTFVGLGWMGVVWWNDASSYDGKVSRIHGYPCGPNGVESCGTITTQRCNASPRADKRCDGWMYGDDSSFNLNSFNGGGSGTLKFYNDVSHGNSGSAVRSTANNIMAVATNCPGENSSTQCYGPRFRTSMWNDVCSWIAAMPSTYAQHSLCN